MKRARLLIVVSAILVLVGSLEASSAEAGVQDLGPSLHRAGYADRASHRYRGENRTGSVTRGAQSGVATWYGPGFHGRKTASGERFNAGALTAAHRTLPFGTRVEVVNEATGRSVVVRINDRGPFGHRAVIDLSRASAAAIGITGSARVRLVTLG